MEGEIACLCRLCIRHICNELVEFITWQCYTLHSLAIVAMDSGGSVILTPIKDNILDRDRGCEQ